MKAKRTLSMLLVFVMIMSLMNIPAFAMQIEEGEWGEDAFGFSYFDNQSIAVGETKALPVSNVAYVESGSAIDDYQVEYVSSDTSVATVDANGNVTGVGAGTAVITATVTVDNENVSDATCTVTVTAPDLPAAGVTVVNGGASAVPVWTYTNQFENTGWTVNVANVYDFAATEMNEEVNNYYADWNCDFRVTLNGTVAPNSFGLFGSYGDYNVAFTIPQELPASYNTLLLGFLGMERTYSDILNEVGTFRCGAFNLSADNYGKSMTVDLVIWKGDSGEKVIATKTYDFSDLAELVDPNAVPAQPEAVITVENDVVTAVIDDGFFAGDATESVTIAPTSGSDVSVTFNAAAVQSFADAGAVTLTVEPTEAVEANAVAFEITLTDENGENVFTGSEGAAAEVTVPVTFTNGQLVAVYLVSNGLRTKVGTATVVNGTVTFSVGHFSIYEIEQTVALPTVNVETVANPNQAAPIKDDLTAPTTGDEDKAALGCEYVFTTAPTQAQLDAYGSAHCDYTVSFDKAVAADSFGLYGKFSFGSTEYEAAFPFQAVAADTPVFLLESAGLDGITFSDVNTIGSFDCGAYNCSADNIGTVMTVSMVIWTADDKSDLEVLDSRSYTFAAPPAPTATITQVAEPGTGKILYDTGTLSATEKTVDLSAECAFNAGTPAENVLAYYGDGNWLCDFEVSFSNDVPANTMALWGAYAGYDVAFVVPMDVPANTGIKLLDTVNITMRYEEVVADVGNFRCGIANLSELNDGTVMSVNLVIWNRNNPENTQITIATNRYTFSKDGMHWVDPLPGAVVTTKSAVEAAPVYTEANLGSTLGTAYVPVVYNFQPDADSVSGTLAYETYKDWNADFVVSFDAPVAAQSIGLYGKYDAYGDTLIGDVAFLNPMNITANQDIYLLATALGLDNNFHYYEVADIVQSFDCGAFNLSDANVGKTMTVKLVIFQRDANGNPINVKTIDEESYKFDKHTYWTVDGVGYYFVPTGLDTTNGKVIENNALVPQTVEGPHFMPDIKYTVSVSSQVGQVTGGGEYPAGDPVTVTAFQASGYSFVGWYVGEERVSTDRVYTFRPDSNVDLVAVYQSTASFNLKVTGNQYLLDDVEQYSTITRQFPANTQHTLVYNGNDRFLYWVNASDNIVSTNPTYKFTLVSNTELTAVSAAAEGGSGDPAKITVAFLNAYSQVIRTGSAEDEFDLEDLFPSSYPSKMGYTCIGWEIKENGQEASIANILALAEPSNPIYHIQPKYVRDQGSYNLNVYLVQGGTPTLVKTLNAAIGNKIIVTKANVAAWGSVAADDIGYWSLDNQSVATYANQYTALYATADEYNLYAVVAEVEPQAVVSITQQFAATSGSKYKISTTMKYFVPSNCTLVESGFVYGTSTAQFGGEGGEDNLVLDAAKTYKHLSSVKDKSGTYTFNGTISKATTVLYIRAFLTYVDANGEAQTIYSPMYAKSYNDLTGNG